MVITWQLEHQVRRQQNEKTTKRTNYYYFILRFSQHISQHENETISFFFFLFFAAIHLEHQEINLKMQAFHHFDTDNEGYITKNDLKEVFKRQGQKLSSH